MHFDVVLGEPVENAAQHILAVGKLFDRMAFIGIEHHLRLDVGFLECSLQHFAHCHRATTVVGGM